MTVKEVLAAAGSWEIRLSDRTPDEIVKKLGLFGHIVILRGRVDVESSAASLLGKARYVGILRNGPGKNATERTIGGPGMVTWLGDEDEKGQVIENVLKFTAQPLGTVLPFFIPSSLTLGTVYPLADPSMRYTGSHQFETQRSALTTICDAFGIEFRVNNDGTVDFGRQDQLYTSTPDSIIVRRGAGTDLDLVALGGEFETDVDGDDYTTRILLLGQKTGTGDTPDQIFATGSADAPSVPYLDLKGNPVKRTRMISESGQTVGSVFARAQLQLNRFNRVQRSLKVIAEDFEISGNFRVGDNCYVYDPDTGIVNATYQVDFRGELLHPDIVRVTEVSWPVTDDHTVAFRTGAGEWLDLTRYVEWETGSNDLVVGDLPRSLTSSGGNPIQDRANSGGSKIPPATPTGLALSTSSTVTPKGVNAGIITASWDAPTLNTDGSTLSDLDHYVIAYHWTGRPTRWQWVLTEDTTIDIDVVIDLDYEVRVAAVDTSGNYSPYSAVVGIHTAADSVGPPAPADPVVSNYLGQLRIEYAGTSNTGGAMPADTNRVDVHVSASSGFTPSAATRVSSLNPFAKGVAFADTPYSVTYFVKLVAYDHTGNASAVSGQVSGFSQWVNNGDIANLAVNDAKIANLSVGKLTAGTMSADVAVSGRFTTALTGARREMNAAGFQAFDASNNLLINFDGVNNLLTGKFRTAIAGRRTEIYALGSSISRINFYADDNTLTEIAAYTSIDGTEVLKLSIPNTGTAQVWNAFQIQQNEYAYMASNTTTIYFGGYSSGSGSFRVDYAFDRGTPSTYPTTTNRLFINYSTAGMSVGHFGEFYINEIMADASQIYRFRMTTAETSWSWEGSNSHAYVRKDNGTDRSAGFAMTHPTAGYGASMTYVASSSDGVTLRRLEVKDINDSTFMPISAGAYTNASARAGKEKIADLSRDALAVVRSMRVREYDWKTPKGLDGKVAVEKMKRRQIGLIAEEAPAEVLVLDENGDPHGVDLYAMISLQAQAVQQLADRLDSLDRKGKP